MSAFNPGDILTISSTSYQKGRRFTVVESNGHRTTLTGPRGAHRVLVVAVPWCDGGDWENLCHIHEDDGEKNRSRPCTVDQVESGTETLPTEGWLKAVAEEIAAPFNGDVTIETNRESEPRAVAHARVMETWWGIASAANQSKAMEALAAAITSLHAGDLGGARSSAESAVRRLSNAKVLEYVARIESGRDDG